MSGVTKETAAIRFSSCAGYRWIRLAQPNVVWPLASAPSRQIIPSLSLCDTLQLYPTGTGIRKNGCDRVFQLQHLGTVLLLRRTARLRERVTATAKKNSKQPVPRATRRAVGVELRRGIVEAEKDVLQSGVL
jgi:hypothetical protein